ncbi:MAG: hypothetical protein H7Z75_01200, partial [Ferruginibacter sp.]|nr:hypothetical protein [Cytophagales bacterium]
ALYDIVGDELIIQHYNRGFEIQLLREKISHFSLPNHTFVRLVPDSTNAALRAGFYDQLYDGKVAVLAKRTKIVEESTTQGTTRKEFVSQDRYFIRKDQAYYPVKSKGSVMNVFKDRKKPLSKYLKEKKIRFREDPEYATVALARYYDTLGNPQ